jgi:hypothetical protein
MDWSIVLQNLLDAAAITQPVEGGAPEVLAVLIDGSTTDSCLTNKQVIMLFLRSAPARAEPDWPKAGTF